MSTRDMNRLLRLLSDEGIDLELNDGRWRAVAIAGVSLPQRPVLEFTGRLVGAWITESRRDVPDEPDPVGMLALTIAGMLASRIGEVPNTTSRIALERGPGDSVTLTIVRDHDAAGRASADGPPPDDLSWSPA